MFIHLGENVVVPVSEIIAILDGQLYFSSNIVQEFIEAQKQTKEIIEISTTMKTIIVTMNQIYFSPLASVTLKRRATQIFESEQIM
ncbi:extracellular matrix regulator RemB [Bacillus pinisoli]|uniref:extracellular matrix regulator RemB n=1 Tax=Bacillus pinisoli TaxID=2901866 RepID=UPI001FF41D42|nr:extracellular matrix/biofilm biosynthesis regulator RemA family protein [Bacillus pinisoli]